MLLAALLPALAQLLCRSADECGEAHGLCGSLHGAYPLAKGGKATVCVGFQDGATGGSSGKKALFEVEVDRYASLSVDSLRTLMGQPWSDAKAEFSHVWLGTQGRRTIGQQRGALEGPGNCTGLTGPGAVSSVDGGAVAAIYAPGPVCYGWSVHNKPAVLLSGELSQGLTAIVHLRMGRVSRIVWDSGCNLCPAGKPGLSCRADGTNISCTSSSLGGSSSIACDDCYSQINSNCNDASAVCAPKVYVAWLGTDMHGAPLLSAGSVLSRFQQGSLKGAYDALASEIVALGDGLTGGGGAGGSATPSPPPP